MLLRRVSQIHQYTSSMSCWLPFSPHNNRLHKNPGKWLCGTAVYWLCDPWHTVVPGVLPCTIVPGVLPYGYVPRLRCIDYVIPGTRLYRVIYRTVMYRDWNCCMMHDTLWYRYWTYRVPCVYTSVSVLKLTYNSSRHRRMYVEQFCCLIKAVGNLTAVGPLVMNLLLLRPVLVCN